MDGAWGMLTVGGAVIAFGVILLVRGMQVQNHGVVTIGTVTAIGEEHTSGADSKTLYYPVVSFMDLNGEEQTFRDTLQRSWKHYAIGQKVSVIYLPEEPGRASIDSGLELFFGPVCCMLIGMPMVAMALLRLLE